MDRQGCKVCFFISRKNLAIFSTDLTLEGSLFQRVGTATKKLVPILVLTLGIKGKSELDDRSWTCFLTGVSNECKYDGCLQESVWYLIIQILKMIPYRTGSLCRYFRGGIARVKR